MSNTKVAQTILDQMGGSRRLKAMVNARDFTAINEYGLRFRFSGTPKANVATIHLNPSDTYRLGIYHASVKECRLIGEADDLYFDQLTDAFESITGLALTL